MNVRSRKFVGTFGLLGVLVLYTALAVTVHQLVFAALPLWVQLPYFAVAGMGWAFPAMVVIRWMARPD